MKDFVMKHPFFTLCMTYTVCRTIENCILGHRKKGVFEAAEAVMDDINEIKEEHGKKSGVIGFMRG